MKKLLLFFTFSFFFICNGVSAADGVWIQYDTTTGAEVATNSQKVSDADLAAAGRAQIFYSGANPYAMMVDVTQIPPVVIPAPPPPVPSADMITLMFNAMVQSGQIDPSTIDPALLSRVNASLAVTGAPTISIAAPIVTTPVR